MAAYPRKQTVVIFVVCILAVSGVAFYVYSRPGLTYTSSSEQVATKSAKLDGSFPTGTNWQKQFLDQSATSTAFRTGGNASAPSANSNLTVTDRLSQGLLSGYAALQQAGLAGNTDAVSNAMSQVASDNTTDMPGPRIYYLKQVAVTPDSKQSFRDYRNIVDSAYKEYLSIPDGASVALQAFNDDDMSELAQIDSIASSYKSLLDQLSALPVPKSFSSYHTDLLNGLSAMYFINESFRHIDKNPMQGLAAVKLDATAEQDLLAAFSEIQDYFAQTGTSTES